ncbi:MAG: hypothetical protein DRN30_02185 [Thermoplasmata archaeon]|nr:MAG: hypothetical protein DRN30_02185 [Thermoplasmata archaeon]
MWLVEAEKQSGGQLIQSLFIDIKLKFAKVGWENEEWTPLEIGWIEEYRRKAERADLRERSDLWEGLYDMIGQKIKKYEGLLLESICLYRWLREVSIAWNEEVEAVVSEKERQAIKKIPDAQQYLARVYNKAKKLLEQAGMRWIPLLDEKAYIKKALERRGDVQGGQD